MPDRRWFDVYTRMLEETVRELPAEKVPVKIHSSLNLGLDLRIHKAIRRCDPFARKRDILLNGGAHLNGEGAVTPCCTRRRAAFASTQQGNR